MKKEKYENIELEIIVFKSEDIMSASLLEEDELPLSNNGY